MAAAEYVQIPMYQTTYKESYRPGEGGLPMLFHQQPAIELSATVPQLAPRSFPLIPAGPHRRLTQALPALGPGLGTGHLDTERYLDKKPIVKTGPPRQLGSDVLLPRRRASILPPQRTRAQRLLEMRDALRETAQEELDAITKKFTWTSTTRRSTEEWAVPMRKVKAPETTFEENADMVLQRPKKYEARPGDWQRTSGLWDRAQMRAPTDRRTPETHLVQLQPTRLLPRRKTRGQPTTEVAVITDLIHDGNLNTPYVRQTPGYAGFIPRSPIEAPLARQADESNTTSIMRESYKVFPEEEYRLQCNHHQGPLSRTVTLTYPYNPFNKLEKRES